MMLSYQNNCILSSPFTRVDFSFQTLWISNDAVTIQLLCLLKKLLYAQTPERQSFLIDTRLLLPNTL